MESPAEKQQLSAIARPGQSYTIAERIKLEHMTGRMQVGTLVLEPGDVITVRSNDERHGLSFTCSKYQGTVIISPTQAASVGVEHE